MAHDAPHAGSHSSDSSDGVLLRRLQGGEQDAATAIYLRYATRLQQLARSQTGRELSVRLDPEDVVQSVFRTFFRRAATGHYEVPDGEELWKLLLVIALNKIRTLGEYHRAAKRDVKRTTEMVFFEPASQSAAPADEQAFRILRMTVDDALTDLLEVQRQMITLRIEGHDIDTIAQKTQRSKRSVERVLQRFRKKMGELISDD